MKPEVKVIHTRAEMLADGDIARVEQRHADGAIVRTSWRPIEKIEEIDNGMLRLNFEGGKYHHCNRFDLIEVQVDHEGAPS